MLLINYDFHDIHAILTMLRAYPEKPYNVQIIESVIQILSSPQIDNSIDDNIIRKKLRTIDTIDKEYFRWVFVDNIYTYGLKVIKPEFCYFSLKKDFQSYLNVPKMKIISNLKPLQMHFTIYPSFSQKIAKISRKQPKSNLHSIIAHIKQICLKNYQSKQER